MPQIRNTNYVKNTHLLTRLFWFDFKMPTIVSQIEAKEKEVKNVEDRLENIEKLIRVKDLSEEELKSLTEEESKLKKKLNDSNKDLSGLRKENWKSSVISFAMFGLGVGFYYLLWGT